MGVDPGLRKTGWGIVRIRAGAQAYVASGLLLTDSCLPHIERLRVIGDGVGDLLRAHEPDVIGIERVFISKNLKSSLELGEARGVALMALLRAGKPIVELSALQIKQSVTGGGRADKTRVSAMVTRLLAPPPPAELPHDCADALACALAAWRAYVNPLPVDRRGTGRRRRGNSLRQFAKKYISA